MREIKFIQYIWESNKWGANEKLKGEMLDWEDLIREDVETLASTFTTTFANASKPMQYTGLKDKNKQNEIYECDLLKHETGWIGEVYFNDGAYRIKNEAGNSWLLNKRRAEKMIKIGNKYTHPELAINIEPLHNFD